MRYCLQEKIPVRLGDKNAGPSSRVRGCSRGPRPARAARPISSTNACAQQKRSLGRCGKSFPFTALADGRSPFPERKSISIIHTPWVLLLPIQVPPNATVHTSFGPMIEQTYLYLLANINQFELRKRILRIMGQFLDYLATIFTGNKVTDDANKANTSHHVTFADNSFTQAFRKSSTQATNKLVSLKQSNKRTIYTYQAISGLACLIHLVMVTLPKIRLEDFNVLQPDGWQLITLSIIPIVVHLASIGAMFEFSRPLDEASQLTSKNSNLNLNENDFIYSLKIIILLMAMCQMSSIVSDQLLWSTIMVVPLWCYQLTSRMARTENERFVPSQKKSWVKGLNSPTKPATPTPKRSSEQASSTVKNTPRTRTRKAVKNIISGVSEKYHTFEQNVAHQLSQKIFTPLSPRVKMLETQ